MPCRVVSQKKGVPFDRVKQIGPDNCEWAAMANESVLAQMS